ncbi:MAG TPA: histidine kinase [Blastocatellia bacterium]|nr:histidine kinase [Blastocatellia bacterium]
MSFLVEGRSGKQISSASRVPAWLLTFGAWTLAGMLVALITYSQSVAAGRPFPFSWWEHLRWALAECYVWWALTPLVALLVRRFPLEPRRWPRALPAYVASIIFFPFAWAVILASLYRALGRPSGGDPEPFGEFVWVVMIARFPALMLVFFAIAAAAHAVEYRRRYQEREFLLAQAQLRSLKAQLNPHFLFNTLNAVSELVYRDPEAAERTIINLSDLLRTALSMGDAQLVSLQDEIDFLRRYVDIHRTIMRDRLAVEFNIESETVGASVPSMILQPLVENAIRHGIDPVSRSGRIEVSAARDNGALRLTVSDSGPGLSEQGQLTSGKGIGLANTQARLAQLYGKSHRFELKSSPGRGLTVNVFIPLENR